MEDQVQDVVAAGGTKYDDGKPRPELIPPEAVDAMSIVLADGAKKYGDRNWEKGIATSRLFGAVMRHLWAYWRGEYTDKESGRPHLWHALTTLAMLVATDQRSPALDDRPGVV